MTTRTNPTDVTARARIRDTAIVLFADHGYRGVSIRDIAAGSGVSAGLVQHHFGTKERLREECDVHAFSVLRSTKIAGLEPEATKDPLFLAAAYQNAIPVVRYIARALVDSSPGAATLFEEMVAMTEDLIQRGQFNVQTDDIRAFSTVLTSQALGVLVLHQHVSRSLGADVFTMPGYIRLARATLELYSSPVIPSEMAASMREGLGGLDPNDDNRPPSRPTDESSIDV